MARPHRVQTGMPRNRTLAGSRVPAPRFLVAQQDVRYTVRCPLGRRHHRREQRHHRGFDRSGQMGGTSVAGHQCRRTGEHTGQLPVGGAAAEVGSEPSGDSRRQSPLGRAAGHHNPPARLGQGTHRLSTTLRRPGPGRRAGPWMHDDVRLRAGEFPGVARLHDSQEPVVARGQGEPGGLRDFQDAQGFGEFLIGRADPDIQQGTWVFGRDQRTVSVEENCPCKSHRDDDCQPSHGQTGESQLLLSVSQAER
jgi:hypothetical protein